MRKLALAALAACLSLVAPASNAAVLFSFEEAGGDVVGSFSGSLNLTDAAFHGNEHPLVGIEPNAARMYSIATETVLHEYRISGPESFGSGGFHHGRIATGSNIAIVGDRGFLFLDTEYNSGDALTGSLLFAESTFASLGITPGEYLFRTVER